MSSVLLLGIVWFVQRELLSWAVKLLIWEEHVASLIVNSGSLILGKRGAGFSFSFGIQLLDWYFGALDEKLNLCWRRLDLPWLCWLLRRSDQRRVGVMCSRCAAHASWTISHKSDNLRWLTGVGVSTWWNCFWSNQCWSHITSRPPASCQLGCKKL